MTTTVMNCTGGKRYYDIYIGRWTYPIPFNSKWHNPFKEKDYGREKAIELFSEYILKPEQKYLLECLPELKDKVLGCWCKPLPCHGDTLVQLVEKYV
jgi:hypothetical protein